MPKENDEDLMKKQKQQFRIQARISKEEWIDMKPK
jgi:hypothetical protein